MQAYFQLCVAAAVPHHTLYFIEVHLKVLFYLTNGLLPGAGYPTRRHASASCSQLVRRKNTNDATCALNKPRFTNKRTRPEDDNVFNSSIIIHPASMCYIQILFTGERTTFHSVLCGRWTLMSWYSLAKLAGLTQVATCVRSLY